VHVSAYIPCYNNRATIQQALSSLLSQSMPVDDLFVIDDGSTDGSAAMVEAMRVRMVRHYQNLGRGATRARAMNEARHELVLSCDATNVLPADFLRDCLAWFNDPKVAAVFGRITQTHAQTVVDRWRGRHLYKLAEQERISRHNSLATGGAMLRKAAVLAAGGFNPQLRHSEDFDLGQRLLASGYDVVYDPRLPIISIATESLAEVLERYWRWNSAKYPAMPVHSYLKTILYSIKVMARADLRACDIAAIPISLLSPHYQFWRSLRRLFK